MRKISRRMWFTPALLALGMSACAVFYISSSGKVQFIILTPGDPVIAVGGVQQFTLNVTYGDGFVTQPDPASATWATSNPAVAVVNSQGQATGLNTGTAVITGTYKGASGSTVVTVKARGSVNFQVSGSAGTLKVSFLKTGRKFLYAVNPVDDTISIYEAAAPQDRNRLAGLVSVVPGRGPVWLAISASGKFLYVANHDSGNVSVFVINPATGRLGSVPGSPFDAGGKAWAVAVDSSGEILSATDLRTSSVTRFHLDAASGALELWR